jgi:diacylglycerol kinase (ATP)
MAFISREWKKVLQSGLFAVRGIAHAYCADKSFRMEVNYGLPLYVFLGWYLAPFAPWEFIMFVFSYFFILVVELMNTAFEKMLDRLHPDEHELIGKSKDIASAAVFLAFCFAIVVLLVLWCVRLDHGLYDMAGGFFV